MIIIGADHGGFELKEKMKDKLCRKGLTVVDVGAYSLDNEDDFSKFVKLMCNAFDNANQKKQPNEENQETKIIAFCGSGVGVCIGLNKHKNILCAVGHSKEEVEKACLHNGINALALGGRVVSVEQAEEMIDVFLATKSLGGKYERRMKEICE